MSKFSGSNNNNRFGSNTGLETKGMQYAIDSAQPIWNIVGLTEEQYKEKYLPPLSPVIPELETIQEEETVDVDEPIEFEIIQEYTVEEIETEDEDEQIEEVPYPTEGVVKHYVEQIEQKISQ